MENTISPPTAEETDWFELGHSLGQSHAFGVVAGRCSAAQAAGLYRLREDKAYLRRGMTWDEFCPAYVKISRSEADRIIRLWQEFGEGYFEIAQLTRVSAETYRAIASSVKDGHLLHNGESIELNAENSRKVAAAVADMRRELAAAKEPERPPEIPARLEALDKLCDSVISEFRRIARDKPNEADRIGLTCVLYRVHDALADLALQHGLG
jgi:hypothetical protein